MHLRAETDPEADAQEVLSPITGEDIEVKAVVSVTRVGCPYHGYRPRAGLTPVRLLLPQAKGGLADG